eukprot:5443684-Pyramimonas_sp.AAC.1
MVTKTCGVSILVHKKIPPTALRSIYYPPSGLQGRAAGIKLHVGDQDYALFSMYFAPVHVRCHSEIGRRLCEWLEHTTDRLGARAMIVIGGDINSDLGLYRAPDGLVQKSYEKCLGPYAQVLENDNGTTARKLASHSELAFVTTYHDIGHTFVGPQGGLSR